MNWCDFHIHTTYSDGEMSLREVIDLYGRHSFGAIAITDHLCDDISLLGLSAKYLKRTLYRENFEDYLEHIQEEALRAKQLYDMLVIPGVEITFNSFKYAKSAHILALGIHSYIDPNQSIEKIFIDIRNQGAISVAAHPVSTKLTEPQTYFLWNHRNRFRHLCDLWEVASGPYLFEEVMNSDLAKIANSDLHKKKHFLSWKTQLPNTDSFREVKKNIFEGKLKIKFFHGHEEESCLKTVSKMQKTVTRESKGLWYDFESEATNQK